VRDSRSESLGNDETEPIELRSTTPRERRRAPRTRRPSKCGGRDTGHDSWPQPQGFSHPWLVSGHPFVALALCIVGLAIVSKLTQSNPHYADGGWLWVPLILGGLAFVLFFVCLIVGIRTRRRAGAAPGQVEMISDRGVGGITISSERRDGGAKGLCEVSVELIAKVGDPH
jgi:hypothetical protein